jgi:biotin carboxylase
MAHLLVIELPGGNDTDILQAAVRQGHTFTFLSQNISAYQTQSQVNRWVSLATDMIYSPSFDYEVVEAAVLQSHAIKPFDAVLCLIDIRLIEASKLAKRLGLRYLNEASATLLRDKYSVREQLKDKGIPQPAFQLATSNAEVLQAIYAIGLPILLKPSDGYGSQNILTLQTQEDLDLAEDALAHLLPLSTDYGLGVRSNDRLLIEQYMQGVFIGCDTFTMDGQHQLLGVNEKLMFAPPSFAIKGGCFTPNQGQLQSLEKYVFSILDAVNFDWGAAHIEIMLTPEGPRLVEINPRLVGAKIARLIGLALNTSVHEALIDLHLGIRCLDELQPEAMQYAVTRWLVASQQGKLERIVLPDGEDEGIRFVEMLASAGDKVYVPFENAHRLGYVMTCSPDRLVAEALAEKYILNSEVILNS